MYTKSISFEVLKKGRKYFRIRYNKNSNEFQLLINDLTKDFVVGQRVENLICTFETQHSLRGQKTTAIAVDETFLRDISQKERQSKIHRWRGYVESKLNEGSVYSKGIEKLRELGFDVSVYNSQIAEIREANRLESIKKWEGFCESAAIEGREYVNGFSKLRELGVPERIEYFKQLARENKPAKVERATESRTVEAEKDSGQIDYWFGSPAWNSQDEKMHLQVGDVFERDGQFFKILTQRRQFWHEDGLSFGLADDSGEIVIGKASPATAEESAPLREEMENAERRRAESRAIQAERNELREFIRSNGQRLNGCAGELLLSTVKPFGGGDWFQIDEQGIWYCQNNGHDGDDWSLNNVRTWGAGAIGWCVPFEES